ncbi:MAG: phenylacetic acid degradation protein PaaN [Rhodospirillum sp.]|nr:phenylacetic acid degradation protein PaaN [Rhodospirillum sp.]MCF8489182.1 phenylacetic acid degradation protein PaaN [Rhodospirillum sp.]
MAQALFLETHRQTLEAATRANRDRGFWTPYVEAPSRKAYGETAAEDGEAAFKAHLNGLFEIPGHPAAGGPLGKEESPFGLALGVTYPSTSPAALIDAAQAAMPAWAAATPDVRATTCLEILERLNKRSFEIGHAVMHTTGQAFMMAFQAGGPHAQDRGLEAVAMAHEIQSQTPASALWEKPQGKADPLRLEKTFRIIPRGVSLMIGCSTFPCWNGYPGLFASLATGNPVIVKPHPGAILPLAITVRVAREVLTEAGFDPNLILLAVDEPGAETTKALVTDPAIRIIDYTGSGTFGQWVRGHAMTPLVFTEEAGINPVVITGTDDLKGLCRNLAFSLALYSGQMCTAPQNIFLPREDIATDQGSKSADEIAEAIAVALDKLLGDPERAAGVCGAIQSPATLTRIADAAKLGAVLRPSIPIAGMDGARSATPLLVTVAAADEAAYLTERFGPIAFIIVCDSVEDALDRAVRSTAAKGAITALVHGTDPAVLTQAEDAFATTGTALSLNLTGGVFVNQSAAFSDYHVSGANPSGNACLTDAAYVASRFRVAMNRRPASAA